MPDQANATQENRLPEPEGISGMEDPDRPVLLLCGAGPLSQDVAVLAGKCGFEVDVAHVPTDEAPAQGAEMRELSLNSPEEMLEKRFPTASRRLVVDDLAGLVEICDIGRGHFVCIDLDGFAESLEALHMALQSHAFYIGLAASREERDEIYAILRGRGVPDAELCAVSCPMGLPVGAETIPQKAVAVVAELLAARAGNLLRLRIDN